MSDNIIQFPNKSFKPKPKVTPEEEKITKGPHSDRRKFFDRVFSNTSKNYFNNLINYSGVLKNRNILLKNKKSRKEVEVWNEPLVKYGCMLWKEKILLQSKFKDSIKNVCKTITTTTTSSTSNNS